MNYILRKSQLFILFFCFQLVRRENEIALTSHDADLTKYEYVFFSESISVFDQKYLSEIHRMLERNGFKITSNKSEKRLLQCKFAIDQSSLFGFRVHISLWDGKKIIAVSEAKNPGWGTLIARETAVRDLVNKAVVEIERQLQSKLMSQKPNHRLKLTTYRRAPIVAPRSAAT